MGLAAQRLLVATELLVLCAVLAICAVSAGRANTHKSTPTKFNLATSATMYATDYHAIIRNATVVLAHGWQTAWGGMVAAVLMLARRFLAWRAGSASLANRSFVHMCAQALVPFAVAFMSFNLVLRAGIVYYEEAVPLAMASMSASAVATNLIYTHAPGTYKTTGTMSRKLNSVILFISPAAFFVSLMCIVGATFDYYRSEVQPSVAHQFDVGLQLSAMGALALALLLRSNLLSSYSVSYVLSVFNFALCVLLLISSACDLAVFESVIRGSAASLFSMSSGLSLL